jgi:type II secretory pathway pseudopilin PulG
LVELIVVAAIIAILVALAFPALAKARTSVRRTQCISNLRQVGLGLSLYTDDFHKYPAFGWPDTGTGPSTNARPTYWDAGVLAHVGSSRDVFRCPGTSDIANNVNSNWSFVGMGRVWPNRSYGYNSYGALSESHLEAGMATTLGLSESIFSPYAFSPFVPEFVSEASVAHEKSWQGQRLEFAAIWGRSHAPKNKPWQSDKPHRKVWQNASGVGLFRAAG